MVGILFGVTLPPALLPLLLLIVSAFVALGLGLAGYVLWRVVQEAIRRK